MWKASVTHENPVDNLRHHAFLMEPMRTCRTLNINQIWVVGFFTLTITFPWLRGRHNLFSIVVITWSGIVNVFTSKTKLSIFFICYHCALIFDTLHEEIMFFFWRKQLCCRNKLPILLKYKIREIVLPEHPFNPYKSFGIWYSFGFDDFSDSSNIGLIGVQTIEFNVFT